MILGGGVRPQGYSYYGLTAPVDKYVSLNAHQSAHYRRWMPSIFEEVDSRVGWIAGDLFHLWHGHAGLRRINKFEEFRVFDFSPELDLEIVTHQPFRWSSDKPEMHRFVAQQFSFLADSSLADY